MTRDPEKTSDRILQDLVLVTGPAGAGRTTAIHALEDFGFEAIDNLPLTFLPRLIAGGNPGDRPLAVGVDLRTRDFSPDRLMLTVDALRAAGDVNPTLLYLDCAPDTLLRRFSETRRRHPLAREDSAKDGIARERALLEGLRVQADILIDTSTLSPHDLRAELARWFDQIADNEIALLVQSFSYKRGLPSGADMVMDLRFLRNPHWSEDLRPLDGRDAGVADYVRADPRFDSFFEKLMDITVLLLPAYKSEGKSYFSLALGCTGGRHRSVFVTEALAKGLAEAGWQVSIRHRELDGGGTAPRLQG